MAASSVIRAPRIPLARLSALLVDHFPFSIVEEASIKPLDGYDDRNYVFDGELHSSNVASSGSAVQRYVLKIMNSRDSKDTGVVNGLNNLTIYLSERGFKCPHPLTSRLGSSVVVMKHSNLLVQYAVEGGDPTTSEVTANEEDERQYCIRVLHYVEGDVLGYNDHPPQLMYELGGYIGRMNVCMKQFNDDCLRNRNFMEWDLTKVLQLRGRLASAVKDQEKLDVLSKVLDDFEMIVVPVMNELESGCTHNDGNALNIIISSNKTIEGMIDFSDCVYNPYVFELGIALTYLTSRRKDPLNYAKPFIQGYLSEFQLSQKSIDILYYVVMARITQSLINSSWYYKLDPTNEYIMIDSKPLWQLLQTMIATGKEGCLKSWDIL